MKKLFNIAINISIVFIFVFLFFYLKIDCLISYLLSQI